MEHDHRNISRIAGRVWQGMSAVQRAPWVRMAVKEKEGHKAAHPDYKYQRPGANKEGKEGKEGGRGRGKGTEKGKRGRGGKVKMESSEIGVWEILTNEDMEEGLRKTESEGDIDLRSPATTASEASSAAPAVLGQRRSSSCPPPTMETPFEPSYGNWCPAAAEDDSAVRPIRYQDDMSTSAGQHGMMSNMGTPSSLPVESMLLSASTWATLYSVRLSCPLAYASLIW